MPTAPVLRAVLTQSWRRPGSRLLVGLVVIVATAFAATSLMLTDSARATIVTELAGTPQAAALVVAPASGGTGVPDGVEQQVRDVPGVADVAAFGTGTVVASRPGSPGDGEPWTAVAAAGGPLARYPLVQGRLPGDPEGVAVSEETAQRAGLAPGDALSLVGVGGDEEQFVVTGVVRVRLQVLNTVLMQPAVVSRLTGTDPVQLDLALVPGADRAEVGAGVAAAVGDLRVLDGDRVRAGEIGAAFGGIEGIFAALAVFGATAVLAAALTMSCAFGVVTGRQRHTVALLRRVGAGRGQVLRALLVDAALTGLVAGVIGAVLSLGLVEGVRFAIRVGLGEDLPSPGLPVTTLLACAAGAVVTTVLAAVGPAVTVSGEPPAATAGETRSHRMRPRVLRLLYAAALGLASAELIVLGSGVPDPQAALLSVAGAGVLAFGAVLAAGPVLLPWIAWLFGGLLAPLSGHVGRIAGRSVLRAPGRASTTAAALVLAGLLLTVVLVGLQSMTLSVQDRIASQFPAPVTALAAGERALPDDLARRITGRSEVGAVAEVRTGVMRIGTNETDVGAVDAPAFPLLLDGATDAGSLADLVPGTVALDRAQAALWKVGVGSRLQFGVQSGPVELDLVAVYRSSGVLEPVTVHPDDLARLVPEGAALRRVLVAPAGPVPVEVLRGAVADAVGPDPTVLVQVPADARTELTNAVSLTRAVALGLVGATVLVAVCGVAVALALAVRERHRESTTLRALGLTPAQVVAALGAESTLLGLAGVVVGTALGVVFGVLSVRALGELPVIPVDSVLAGAGALVLAAALAGTLPALRAARGGPLPVD